MSPIFSVMQPPGLDLFSLTSSMFVSEFRNRYGKGAFHALALYRELFTMGNIGLKEIPEFVQSPEIIQEILQSAIFPLGTIVKEHSDGVHKLLIDLHDDNAIEAVIIPRKNRHTLCVSSQAGCKMGCTFCATGAQGFSRNLHAREIVHQLFLARFVCGYDISKIVFMGMGEPLDNVETIIGAIRIFSDPRGFNIAPRHITVSTAGHLDGLRQLAQEKIPNLRIAISLNAPEDTLRDQLMPINKRYPLQQLKKELLSFPLGKKGVFLIEYVLIADLNDTGEMAQSLIRWVAGLPVRINLIPYNQNGHHSYVSPTSRQVERFKGWLVDAGIFVRVRHSPGNSIAAACGQLTGRR